MTNTKSTKRALLVSVMAMVICFTMLLGTTFAWFTDSTASTGNKIVAGTLDVELWMHNGTDYEDISGTTESIFGEGSIAKNNNLETLWEPGKTQVAYLAVKNVGSLDLKWKLDLNVSNITENLNEVVSYKIVPMAAEYNGSNGVTSWTGGTVLAATQTAIETNNLSEHDIYYFALVLHMDEDAGNTYQGGNFTLDVNVYATQTNTEADQFGTDYDKDATYPAP